MEDLTHRFRDSQAMAKLIGSAPAFLKAIEQVSTVARSEATVLISGESGTGKELVARADRKSTRLNSSHIQKSRMPSSA